MSARALPATAENLFRYLFEQASLGIAVEDLDGKILLANHALCSMLGYQDDELVGLNCSQFANPEDSQDDWALFGQLRAGIIDHYSLEKRYLKKRWRTPVGAPECLSFEARQRRIPSGFCFCGEHNETQTR